MKGQGGRYGRDRGMRPSAAECVSSRARGGTQGSVLRSSRRRRRPLRSDPTPTHARPPSPRRSDRRCPPRGWPCRGRVADVSGTCQRRAPLPSPTPPPPAPPPAATLRRCRARAGRGAGRRRPRSPSRGRYGEIREIREIVREIREDRLVRHVRRARVEPRPHPCTEPSHEIAGECGRVRWGEGRHAGRRSRLREIVGECGRVQGGLGRHAGRRSRAPTRTAGPAPRWRGYAQNRPKARARGPKREIA